mgnify:CR=1 FL=1
MRQRKIPLRKCVVTNERLPKKELVRIVRNKENEVFVDLTGKQNGRGAYLKLERSVIDQAKKSRILDRTFGVSVPESIYEELYELVERSSDSDE